uniref:KH domain-containing protein n=1 Tax=Heterorhabditis bacteriophora TaxID=37862 RepID=A0A1I7XW88_HETBA
MSAGIITTDAIQEALQRAKELAAVDTSSNTSLKRTLEDDSDQNPAKRANIQGGMDGSGLVQMGGGLGTAPFMQGMQPGMGNPAENVVEVISVPENTVGLVIGRGGSEIQNIQNTTGCRVQMSPESEPGSGVRQCTLQGNKMSVDRAKQMISEVISRAGQRQAGGQQGGFTGGDGRSITFEMLIPATKCGLVIGKQGDTIKQLQEQAGCKMVMIQDSQEVTGQAKPLRITGDPDKIELAKRLVTDLINSREDNGMGGGSGGGHRSFNPEGATAKGEVCCDIAYNMMISFVEMLCFIIFKNLGCLVGNHYLVRLDDPSSPDRCAVIMGTREQIYKATELITELVHKSCNGGGAGGGGSGGNEVFYMHVPANKTGLVIGKGGETIKQINAESGAHCELSRDPPPNAQEKVFIIKGSPYQIHHAQHIIRIKVLFIFNILEKSAHHFSNKICDYNYAFDSTGQQPDAGNGWAAQATQPYYGGAPAAAQPAAAYAAPQQYQAPVAQPYAAPAAQPTATAQPAAAQGTPAINPQTGQPDYSAQWAEYYRSMGLHDQAAMIENQMKQNQAARPAAAQPAAYGATGAYQGGATAPATTQYAGYAGQPGQAFPQTGQFTAQPQQF